MDTEKGGTAMNDITIFIDDETLTEDEKELLGEEDE